MKEIIEVNPWIQIFVFLVILIPLIIWAAYDVWKINRIEKAR